MIRKRNTKFALNHIASNDTASLFLSNIKSIGAYSLLVTMFALFTMTASITPAQAELVDLSSPEPVIKFASRDAYWVKMPIFKIGYHCLKTMNTGDKFNLLLDVSVDKQGKITSIKIIESSGHRCLDRSTIQQAKNGQTKPFMIKGKAVIARFSLPIRYVVRSVVP